MWPSLFIRCVVMAVIPGEAQDLVSVDTIDYTPQMADECN